MPNRYLIYEKNHGGHAVVHFVRADDLAQAILHYIQWRGSNVVALENNALSEDGIVYAHPLAYIEAIYKTIGEWQIRELPDWALEDTFVEAFCGESDDGPAYVIGVCRNVLRRDVPRSRAHAFIWYLQGGRALVTFYRKRRPFQIEIVRRYVWNWNGEEETVQEWEGDYQTLTAELNIKLLRGYD